MEIDPPRLPVHSWVASWMGDVKTKVRWESEPTKQGILVRIRNSGFAAHPELASSYSGWPRLLGWLRANLERGETIDDRKPASWNLLHRCPVGEPVATSSVQEDKRQTGARRGRRGAGEEMYPFQK
jgi:hypothetical protein